jgi:hypothetical protein
MKWDSCEAKRTNAGKPGGLPGPTAGSCPDWSTSSGSIVADRRVQIGPGATQMTRAPRWASSSARFSAASTIAASVVVHEVGLARDAWLDDVSMVPRPAPCA